MNDSTDTQSIREKIALILADVNNWDNYSSMEKNHFIVKANKVIDLFKESLIKELPLLNDCEIELAWSFSNKRPSPEAGGINTKWLPRIIITERDRIIAQDQLDKIKQYLEKM